MSNFKKAQDEMMDTPQIDYKLLSKVKPLLVKLQVAFCHYNLTKSSTPLLQFQEKTRIMQ